MTTNFFTSRQSFPNICLVCHSLFVFLLFLLCFFFHVLTCFLFVNTVVICCFHVVSVFLCVSSSFFGLCACHVFLFILPLIQLRCASSHIFYSSSCIGSPTLNKTATAAFCVPPRPGLDAVKHRNETAAPQEHAVGQAQPPLIQRPTHIEKEHATHSRHAHVHLVPETVVENHASSLAPRRRLVRDPNVAVRSPTRRPRAARGHAETHVHPQNARVQPDVRRDVLGSLDDREHGERDDVAVLANEAAGQRAQLLVELKVSVVHAQLEALPPPVRVEEGLARDHLVELRHTHVRVDGVELGLDAFEVRFKVRDQREIGSVEETWSVLAPAALLDVRVKRLETSVRQEIQRVREPETEPDQRGECGQRGHQRQTARAQPHVVK